MKLTIKGLIILSSIAILSLPTMDSLAYDPPGPPIHGQTGDQEPTGGSAPIAGGVPVLIIMGIGYGLKKWYKKDMEGAIEE
ncbi:MAG: hypothetical protein K9H64_21615 [Bacteroidales bacterium]|nr:hypothetical protein [Bacteroidales bacterium]MCF8458660.1 hypothetical protein [Bacteroidales bacterium]